MVWGSVLNRNGYIYQQMKRVQMQKLSKLGALLSKLGPFLAQLSLKTIMKQTSNAQAGAFLFIVGGIS